MSQAAVRDGRRRMLVIFAGGMVAVLVGGVLSRAVLFLGAFGGILGFVGALAALYGFVGTVVWMEAPRAAAALAEPEAPDASG